MIRRTALTGTPGTGKSSIARRLDSRHRAIEVADLARRLEAYDGSAPNLEVDVTLLRKRFRPRRADLDVDLVVGHLAHLLPIHDVVVLRCHPLELDRRLARARKSPDSRGENVVAEAVDEVLVEALDLRRRVWEVDTTGRSVGEVATEVATILRRRPPPTWGAVDWLSDPAVTDHLLRVDR